MNLNSSYGRQLFLEQMGKTAESFEKDIDIIEEWVKTQKHLPEITSKYISLKKNCQKQYLRYI